MTHEELVNLGAEILRRDYSCVAVLSECRSRWSAGHEVPDVIGWTKEGQMCIIIEVKVSMADYRADLKKPHRSSPMFGCGDLRLYLMPEALAEMVLRLPDFPSWWGLIAERQGEPLELREPQEFSRSPRGLQEEVRLLVLAHTQRQAESNAERTGRRPQPFDRRRWLDLIYQAVKNDCKMGGNGLFVSDAIRLAGDSGHISRMKAIDFIRSAVQDGKMPGVSYTERVGKAVLVYKEP